MLDAVRSFLDRFVAFPSYAALAATTLWAAHAHAVRHFDSSPRLALLSPEPGSGKTRVLEVLEPLVPKPLASANASPPAIFRSMAKRQITLLLDEVDTVFQQRGKEDGTGDLRALLNAGYKSGGRVTRTVGPRHDVAEFPVFGAVALAGLNDLPNTLMSRSIVVRMRPRAPDEIVEAWRSRDNEPEALALQERLAAWVAEIAEAAGAARPEMPEGIADRNVELWEPLIAIADAAGGHWPETARDAAVQMVAVAADREASLGLRLLADLRAVWDADEETLPTTDILERLRNLEEAPWADLSHGRGLDSRRLARLLGGYGVKSQQVHPANRRGYRRTGLLDVWRRYLPAPPLTPKGEKETNVDGSSSVQDSNSARSDSHGASERAEREANEGRSARDRKNGGLPFDDGGGDALGEGAS